MTNIHHIQNKSYSVLCKGKPVVIKFVIAELPNNMKMLAFLGGELTNSATYFSTFEVVSKDGIVNCKGIFGPHATDTWKVCCMGLCREPGQEWGFSKMAGSIQTCFYVS